MALRRRFGVHKLVHQLMSMGALVPNGTVPFSLALVAELWMRAAISFDSM